MALRFWNFLAVSPVVLSRRCLASGRFPSLGGPAGYLTGPLSPDVFPKTSGLFFVLGFIDLGIAKAQ